MSEDEAVCQECGSRWIAESCETITYHCPFCMIRKLSAQLQHARRRGANKALEQRTIVANRLTVERDRAQELLESCRAQLKRTQDDRDAALERAAELEGRLFAWRFNKDPQVREALVNVDTERVEMARVTIGDKVVDTRTLANVGTIIEPYIKSASKGDVAFLVLPRDCQAGGTGGAAHPDQNPDSEDQ